VEPSSTYTICLLSKQNHVGVICESNIALDDYYVDFEDRFTGLYPACALSTLLPAAQIAHNLSLLSTSHENPSGQIEALNNDPDVWAKIELMRLARSQPEILKQCTYPLQEHIAQDIINQNHQSR
jgi:hypothetical protein